MKPKSVRIGIIGCGNVGSSLINLIAERCQTIVRRSGLSLEVASVAVRDLDLERNVPIDSGLFTNNPEEIVTDPSIEVVVEVMGGVEPAFDLVTRALQAGKSVVTANKELLAAHGAELYALAEEVGVDLLFEAAVAGAIPIMRPLRESLVGESITRVTGIVNGTTNFILTQMSENKMSYSNALVEAQRLGYAEADPTADVEGFDAAAKLAIIASLAFGVKITSADVYREGITSITANDIEFAGRLGYCVKLLAIGEQELIDETPQVGVRVYPTMVPLDHPLAAVRDSFNAVFVEGDAAGQIMFYGRGAGGRPTSSAVLGDLIDAASNLHKDHGASIGDLESISVTSIDSLVVPYYLEVEVHDQPGALAQVAAIFGEHKVSIRSMEQEGLGDEARLIFITHAAQESNLQATLLDLEGLGVVQKVGSMLRVLGD